MRERPILFQGAMIRALLADTKTQTRRAVKPVSGLHSIEEVVSTPDSRAAFIRHRCPYGAPGDQLWVREAWRHREIGEAARAPSPRSDYVYRASEDVDALGLERWKPSIHMPRKLSRIQLEITDVRVERLQAISEEDAWAEGCARGQPDDTGGFFPAEEPDPSGIGRRGWDCARDWYADLWESINGAGSWDANAYVWAVTFRRLR